ncbi:integrase [Anaerotaenia torta]|uniref:tyrosine-type recombinase/integrase n=1 Tax=Anaerotaenia torta TaxID=433293 RepID=UPI003D25F176
MAKKTKLQTENLPKGITPRINENRYLGRVTYKGKPYFRYDTNVGRLERTLNQLRKDLKEGKDVEAGDKTLNEWFDLYLKKYKLKTVKIGTYENYRRHYNYYIREGIGKKSLKDITVSDIQDLYNSFDDRGFSQGMIKLVNATLNGCFIKAIKNRIIDFNPVIYAEIPKGKPKKKIIALAKDIQQVFLEYAKESYLHGFLRVALMTGLRRGELQALKWQDINFAEKKLYVFHTLIWIERQGYYTDMAKTEHSVRTIPMNSDLLDYMLELKVIADETGMGKGSNYVFSLPDGKLISRYRVTREINKIQEKMKKAGYEVPHFGCHTLRHTYATRAIENKIEPQTLKTLLGHATLAITMDLYAHVMEDVRIAEMEKLNGTF